MKRRRPVIGVTCSRRGGRFLWWFSRLSLRRAGARAKRVTADRVPPIADLDGLVLGGGDDIGASLYGGEVVPDVRLDPERDQLELRLLEAAVRAGVPVLGICRGAQMINVFFGGTLFTDVHQVYETAPRLRTALPMKTVDLVEGSRLQRLMGVRWTRVNSLHHQSIDRTGTGITIAAFDRYGIVQGIEVSSAPFLFGVQWHPEFLLLQRAHGRLFGSLAAAARLRS